MDEITYLIEKKEEAISTVLRETEQSRISLGRLEQLLLRQGSNGELRPQDGFQEQ